MASPPTVEPTKKRPLPIQPNAHPYAIKTTSSGLLSRSNSSPHSAHFIKHHYIPFPPSRMPTRRRVGHCHSSSLSVVDREVHDVDRMDTIPPPLPTPPPVVFASQDNSVSLNYACELELCRQASRVETTSCSAIEVVPEHNKFSLGQESDTGLSKQWETNQLTTCLETTFKSGSTTGDEGDPSLANKCVPTRGLTDRTGMDLAGTSLFDVQHSHTDIHRGPAYVDSHHLHKASHNSKDMFSHFTRSSTPFRSMHASVSADDLRLLLDNDTGGVGTHPPSPAMSLSFRRSNSVSDATAQRYRDLARMRTRRRGRVKGLVETWERANTSGSDCSTSDAETESDADPEEVSGVKHSPESPSDPLSVPHSEPSDDICPLAVDSTDSPQELPILTPPPPYTHLNNVLGAVENEVEEPSIEELLALSPNIPLRGARAWEADFVLGETVKHAPVFSIADTSGPSALAPEPITSRPKDVSQQTRGDSVQLKGVRRNTGSRGKNAKSQKRVVTAIFTGFPSDDESENAADEVHSGSRHHYASDMNGDIGGEVVVSLEPRDDQDSTLRALEQSTAVTRAQVEAFRLRLEKVEADITRQEVLLTRNQTSDSCHPPGSETRVRQSETKITVPTGDERYTDGAMDRDIFEGWETMSLAEVAYTVVTKTMGWLLPYRHLGVRLPGDRDQSLARAGSRPGANGEHRLPAKRSRLAVAHMSCRIIMVSFAIVAAVFRRMWLGRWTRRP